MPRLILFFYLGAYKKKKLKKNLTHILYLKLPTKIPCSHKREKRITTQLGTARPRGILIPWSSAAVPGVISYHLLFSFPAAFTKSINISIHSFLTAQKPWQHSTEVSFWSRPPRDLLPYREGNHCSSPAASGKALLPGCSPSSRAASWWKTPPSSCPSALLARLRGRWWEQTTRGWKLTGSTRWPPHKRYKHVCSLRPKKSGNSQAPKIWGIGFSRRLPEWG